MVLILLQVVLSSLALWLTQCFDTLKSPSAKQHCLDKGCLSKPDISTAGDVISFRGRYGPCVRAGCYSSTWNSPPQKHSTVRAIHSADCACSCPSFTLWQLGVEQITAITQRCKPWKKADICCPSDITPWWPCSSVSMKVISYTLTAWPQHRNGKLCTADLQRRPRNSRRSHRFSCENMSMMLLLLLWDIRCKTAAGWQTAYGASPVAFISPGHH